MDSIQIDGGVPLSGSMKVSGAKNAALPLMTASLLTEEPLILENVPALADVSGMKRLLHHLNVKETAKKDVLTLQADDIPAYTAPYDLVRQMRASILVLGPLLARFKEARISLPGGCAIGTRPVDLHLEAFMRMGAKIDIDGGYIMATASKKGLSGADIAFSKVSVGATENVLMAACLAKGETVLSNAAQEPEIIDLGECLIGMGAKITGLGTSTIKVKGVPSLFGTKHSILPDRIEAATYAMAGAITRGRLEIDGGRTEHLTAVLRVLTDIGVEVKKTRKGFSVNAENSVLIGTDIMTEAYPGFPTDLQAQIMAVLATCHGASLITETIFENRFMHVPELARMGANINIHGNSSAIIRGVPELSGADVMATDLRASVSLVLAGLAAKGTTTVHRIYHLDRGYERLEEKLSGCGARIKRIHNDGEVF